ncbi:hypothetical protein PVAND_003145 [Polypedilum vanderplanki]|uniref:Single domain-containing protein n=1 Tax=Polypedilum vanderplanki TaxID=319348 RepID=A0A9J6BUV5_POLVA|nr:hypothetical protein PVAND_003145 [Polypedilum vanderplanki]
MKSCAIIFVLLSVIGFCFSSLQPVIKNARKSGCFDGLCGSYCEFENVKLFPGDNKNDIGKCRMLRCSSNFDLHITHCGYDMSGQSIYAGADDSKPFPECCGRLISNRRP